MSDREMLELAARAAGIELVFSTAGAELSPRRKDTWVIWNPLTDDGDALRLAVAIREHDVDIRLGDNGWLTCIQVDFWGRSDCADETYTDEQSGDPFAATRRAITRAAAEIGKAMLESAADHTAPVSPPPA